MFAVKMYDLGRESEVVGYYPDALKKKERDEYSQIGSANKLELFQSEEYKAKDNIDRAVRRAKTKIRRCAEKYNLQYMWTLTFAKQITTTYNPVNKKTYKYDCSDWSQAWRLFELFIEKCRSNGLHFNYIVTAEIQEERLATYGEKVYHFHMATDKYIPQNEMMRRKANRSRSYAERYEFSFNDFWTHGFTKATAKKGNKLCTNYLIKYITKAFEMVEVKGKQRYRISNGMEIDFEILKFKDHVEFLLWVETEKQVKTGYKGQPLSKYFILGDSLEIWWLKIATQ